MRRMLINATQPEELRVAVADGQMLIDLDIEVPSQDQKKANVYKGRITRVEPSLEACFVDFGSERHGFLPLKEICPDAYQPSAKKVDGKVSVREAVREGQEIIVQVEKEERGNKGAALTTYISLAGRYLVLMPTNPKAGGVSRRISGEDRQDLREQLQQVIAPDNVGIIIRTAGVGREAEELQWDLDYLLSLWTAIETAAQEQPASFLIYQESNLFIRALRDHLRNDIGEILIDNEKVFTDAREFVQQVMPHNVRKLKLYKDDVPLFTRYQIESQIESAFARMVHLPSGGSLVIDHTEAMLSIDINSARATKGSDIEDTAFKTNLEAADEIARQLRLRDLGGLIVIDFIDMMDRKHQRQVEERLKHALQIDKARVQTGRISRFGLMEMSRQRLRPSLGESSEETCPRCDGHGTIRSIESLALSILRLVEEEAMKEHSGELIVQTPPKVANFLLNEKRKALFDIENRHTVPIVILANEYMQRPKFEIRRVRSTEVTSDPSYTNVAQPQPELVASAETLAASAIGVKAPAVTGVTHSRPAPSPVNKAKPGFFGQFFSRLFSGSEEETAAEKDNARRPAQSRTTKKAPQRKGTRPASADQRPRGNRRGGQGRTQKASDPNRQSTSTGRKKATRKKSARKKTGRAASGNTQAKPQNQAAGNAPADNKEGSSPQKSRRRRSPYQTGGGKQRDNQADTPANVPGSDMKPGSQATQEPAQQAASKSSGNIKLAKSTAPESGVATDPSRQDASERQAPAAEPVKDAGASERKSTSRPRRGKKKAVSENAGGQQQAEQVKETATVSPAKKAPKRDTSGKSESEGSSAAPEKPASKKVKQPAPKSEISGASSDTNKPQVQATRDSKGIYTLKSPKADGGGSTQQGETTP